MRAPRSIDPGALRTRLVLEEATPVPDGAGGHVPAWTAVATLFGRVRPAAATHRFGAGQGLATVTHAVTVRHRAGLRSGQRFSVGTQKLAIETVHDPDGTGRYLQCMTREEGS